LKASDSLPLFLSIWLHIPFFVLGTMSVWPCDKQDYKTHPHKLTKRKNKTMKKFSCTVGPKMV